MITPLLPINRVIYNETSALSKKINDYSHKFGWESNVFTSLYFCIYKLGASPWGIRFTLSPVDCRRRVMLWRARDNSNVSNINSLSTHLLLQYSVNNNICLSLSPTLWSPSDVSFSLFQPEAVNPSWIWRTSFGVRAQNLKKSVTVLLLFLLLRLLLPPSANPSWLL